MAEPLEPKRIPNWEKIWHSGLDYVAPGHEVGSHPIEQGNVNWTRALENVQASGSSGMKGDPSRALQFDIVHTSDYKQEPLPGEWLVFT